MGRHITQVVTGHWHWAAGVQSTESTNIAAWSRHHSTLRTLQWLCTCCRHHVTIMLTSIQTQENVSKLSLSLSHGPRTGSMFVTVCCPAVTSGIIVVVLPNLALEAGNQPGNSGAARGLAPGPVSAGLPRPGLEDVTRPARSSANVATLGREGVPRYCHHHIH